MSTRGAQSEIGQAISGWTQDVDLPSPLACVPVRPNSLMMSGTSLHLVYQMTGGMHGDAAASHRSPSDAPEPSPGPALSPPPPGLGVLSPAMPFSPPSNGRSTCVPRSVSDLAQLRARVEGMQGVSSTCDIRVDASNQCEVRRGPSPDERLGRVDGEMVRTWLRAFHACEISGGQVGQLCQAGVKRLDRIRYRLLMAHVDPNHPRIVALAKFAEALRGLEQAAQRPSQDRFLDAAAAAVERGRQARAESSGSPPTALAARRPDCSSGSPALSTPLKGRESVRPPGSTPRGRAIAGVTSSRLPGSA